MSGNEEGPISACPRFTLEIFVIYSYHVHVNTSLQHFHAQKPRRKKIHTPTYDRLACYLTFLCAKLDTKGLALLDRSLVTLIAQGRLIETIGVKRTLEITNIRANYHVDVERASLKIYPLHVKFDLA